jgi:hypothetical protein
VGLTFLEQEMDFLRGVFLDDDKAPSFSRVATGLIVIVLLFLLSYVTLKNKAFPDLSTLTGLATIIGVLYGANRGENIAAALRGKANPDKPQDSGA